MVADAWLVDHTDGTSQFPVFLLNHGSIFGNGHGVIVISDHSQNGDFRLRQGEQCIDGFFL